MDYGLWTMDYGLWTRWTMGQMGRNLKGYFTRKNYHAICS